MTVRMYIGDAAGVGIALGPPRMPGEEHGLIPPCARCVRQFTDEVNPGWYFCEPCLRAAGVLW